MPFLTIMLTIIMCGCSQSFNTTQTTNVEVTTTYESMCEIEVLDYYTNEVLLHFDGNNTGKTNELLTIINYHDSENHSDISIRPSYIVHFIDNGDSSNDIWYFVYLDGEKLYIQVDISKVSKNESMFDSDIMLCEKTSKDFADFLSK